MYKNWIAASNLLSWLEVLSGLIGYQFDNLDRDAVEVGCQASDREAGRWFEYQLSGRATVLVKVARDVGTDVLAVQVDCPSDLSSRVDTATEIAKEYRLVR